MLRVFRARHPGVRLALEEMHNIEAVNAVRSRYVQLAFVRLPIEPVSELSLVTVRSEPVILAVPEGSALAAREAVDLAELADEDMILIARSQEQELHDYSANGALLQTRYKDAGKQGALVPDNARTALAPGVQYNGSPLFLSEFGGIAWIPPDAKVPQESWGYAGVEKSLPA